MFLQDVIDNGNVICFFVSGGDNPECGPRKANQVVDFKLAISFDQQYRDSPNLLKGKIGKNEFVPVRKLNQDPVQGLDAQIHQAYGKLIRIFTSLPIGKARLVIHKGLFFRVNIRSPV